MSCTASVAWSMDFRQFGWLRGARCLPALAVTTLLPLVSPGIALLIGMIVALTVGNPYPLTTSRFVTPLLQISVAGLGAGMNLIEVGHPSVHGFFYTVIGITLTASIGPMLGHLLGTARETSLLVTVGTAICGGSAIAAVAPVIRAKSKDVSVALATIFFERRRIADFPADWPSTRTGANALRDLECARDS
jgi:uncharacterized membrane protein YadS